MEFGKIRDDFLAALDRGAMLVSFQVLEKDGMFTRGFCAVEHGHFVMAALMDYHKKEILAGSKDIPR